MMGGVFCKADRKHKDNLVNRAKILDSSARVLLGMAKAMLSARANGTDPLAALECTIGWQRLEETVEAMDGNLAGSRTDNLTEVIDSYPRLHRTATIVLGAFTFRSWKSADSLLTALEVLRQLYASGEQKLPAGVPTAFLAPVWRKLIGPGPVIDRRTWEVAVVMTLRDRLRAGDVWVKGSRAFRAVLADATNLGLARMAWSSGVFSHSQLLWTAEWHLRDEAYQAALACLVDAIHAQPFTALWGDGETSSSDGQFFRAGGHGEARADHNAHYGSEPGIKFYTHVSDRFAAILH